MRLVGVWVENVDGYGVSGYVPLEGITVLFGRNGVGKTRFLERASEIVDPGLGHREARSVHPTVWYGSLVLNVNPTESEPKGGREWLATAIARPPDEDFAEWLAIADEEAEGLSRPEVDAAAILNRVDPGIGTNPMWGPAGRGHPGWWEAFVEAVAVEVAGGSLPGWSEAVSSRLMDLGYVMVEPFLTGMVSLAAPPAEEALALRRSLSEVGAGGQEVLAERVLAVGADPRPVLSLARYGGERPPIPDVFEIEAAPSSPEERLDEWIDDQFRRPGSSRDGDPWLEEDSDGATRVRLEVKHSLAEVAREATGCLPQFVVAQGHLSIGVQSQAKWGPGQARSLIRFDLADTGPTDFDLLGAGTRRWVAASILLAVERLGGKRYRRDEQLRRMGAPWIKPRRRLIIVDEPELHLHPTAQSDVASWLRDRVAEGDQVLTATHSPVILNAVGSEAHKFGVIRQAGESVLVPIDGDVIREFALDLGMDPISLLQTTRAVLIVEGEHDRQVLSTIYADDLARHMIRVLPIRGTSKALALAESEFLGSVGIPLRIMFDAVRPEALTPGGVEEPTPEEKKMVEVLDQLRHQMAGGHDVRPVPYNQPDIWCAIPDDVVRRAFSGFPGWDTVIDGVDRSKSFKAQALRMSGLKNLDQEDFLSECLAAWRPGDQPSPELRGAMASLLDEFG